MPQTSSKTWKQNPPSTSSSEATAEISKAVTENAVVIVGRRGCCMVHVVRLLLQGQGVNPALCELDDVGDDMAAAVGPSDADYQPNLPAVFIGGKLVGGLDRLIAVHLSGDLLPILRDAGALWL